MTKKELAVLDEIRKRENRSKAAKKREARKRFLKALKAKKKSPLTLNWVPT